MSFSNQFLLTVVVLDMLALVWVGRLVPHRTEDAGGSTGISR